MSYTSNHVSISNKAEAAQVLAENYAARHAGITSRHQSPAPPDSSEVSQPRTLHVFPLSVFGYAQLLLTRLHAVAGPTLGKRRKRSMPGSRTRSFA